LVACGLTPEFFESQRHNRMPTKRHPFRNRSGAVDGWDKTERPFRTKKNSLLSLAQPFAMQDEGFPGHGNFLQLLVRQRRKLRRDTNARKHSC